MAQAKAVVMRWHLSAFRLPVSACCDTALALLFLLVSVCCDTAQALVFSSVLVCYDTAQSKAVVMQWQLSAFRSQVCCSTLWDWPLRQAHASHLCSECRSTLRYTGLQSVISLHCGAVEARKSVLAVLKTLSLNSDILGLICLKQNLMAELKTLCLHSDINKQLTCIQTCWNLNINKWHAFRHADIQT